MKRLLSRMGLLGVLVMMAVIGQVFFASSAYAISNPSFDWEKSYTADDKLGEQQLTWCSSNLDGETVADIATFRSGSSGQYVNDCLNKSIGGICNTVERGAEQEYRCYRSIPDDHPLVLAIKAAEKNEVGPLAVLYCGTPTFANADSLIACQQAVSTAYFSPKCFYSNQKDSTAGRSSAPDAASCVRDALRNNDKIINKNRTQAQVLTAIRQGRKAANVAIQAAIKTDQSRLQCIEDKGTWENGACVAEGEGENGYGEPVCSAGALGWVICPLAEGMVQIIEQVAELLQGLLIYQPLIGSDQGKSIKAIWSLILVLANTGLVIAILIIVFSQATSVGLSTYGIKKLLPRVFAAAILMNLSFYLCAIAVDLSNILGVSVKGIVEAGMNQLADVNAGSSEVNYGAGIGQYFTVGVVGLVAAAIAIGTGAIWLLLPVLVTAAMAIFTALMILAARQVLITLLIIIAPLAILAWILPNTDEWFTKWRKLFTILLLLFPIIMAVFYGSILVSAVILSAGADTGSGLNDFTIKLLAFLVLIVPLFSLPVIIKAAGGILDRFGVLVNNRNKGLIDRSRKFSEERKGRTGYQRGKAIRQSAKQDFRNKRFAERLNLSNKSLADYKAENGGSLTATQMAQWTRAQHTKGMAGGAGEIARMTGRGAMKGVAKLPDGPGGLTGAARDTALLGGAYAASAAGRIPGGDMRRAQTEALNRGAQFAESKAFNERVSAIQSTYDNMGAAGADTRAYDASTGAGYLEGQYREAIATDNHEQAAAVINRLTGLGAGGRNRLSSVLQSTPVSSGKMQDVITKSVMQDNYGSLVGSRADTAKASGFNATGIWDTSGALGKVGTPQLATQDEKTLYQNFGDISVAEATKIMTEPNLESTVQNAKARAILDLRRGGATSLPTSGLIDISDPALGDWKDLVS